MLFVRSDIGTKGLFQKCSCEPYTVGNFRKESGVTGREQSIRYSIFIKGEKLNGNKI